MEKFKNKKNDSKEETKSSILLRSNRVKTHNKKQEILYHLEGLNVDFPANR